MPVILINPPTDTTPEVEYEFSNGADFISNRGAQGEALGHSLLPARPAQTRFVVSSLQATTEVDYDHYEIPDSYEFSNGELFKNRDYAGDYYQYAYRDPFQNNKPHTRHTVTWAQYLSFIDPLWDAVSSMLDIAYEFSNGRLFEKDARDQFIGARLTADITYLNADTTQYSSDQTNKRVNQ